jgi:hypothetical protein
MHNIVALAGVPHRSFDVNAEHPTSHSVYIQYKASYTCWLSARMAHHHTTQCAHHTPRATSGPYAQHQGLPKIAQISQWSTAVIQMAHACLHLSSTNGCRQQPKAGCVPAPELYRHWGSQVTYHFTPLPAHHKSDNEVQHTQRTVSAWCRDSHNPTRCKPEIKSPRKEPAEEGVLTRGMLGGIGTAASQPLQQSCGTLCGLLWNSFVAAPAQHGVL